jgi:hypothetical protein
MILIFQIYACLLLVFLPYPYIDITSLNDTVNILIFYHDFYFTLRLLITILSV